MTKRARSEDLKVCLRWWADGTGGLSGRIRFTNVSADSVELRGRIYLQPLASDKSRLDVLTPDDLVGYWPLLLLRPGDVAEGTCRWTAVPPGTTHVAREILVRWDDDSTLVSATGPLLPESRQHPQIRVRRLHLIEPVDPPDNPAASQKE